MLPLGSQTYFTLSSTNKLRILIFHPFFWIFCHCLSVRSISHSSTSTILNLSSSLHSSTGRDNSHATLDSFPDVDLFPDSPPIATRKGFCSTHNPNPIYICLNYHRLYHHYHLFLSLRLQVKSFLIQVGDRLWLRRCLSYTLVVLRSLFLSLRVSLPLVLVKKTSL